MSDPIIWYRAPISSFELLRSGVLKAQDSFLGYSNAVIENSAYQEEWGRLIDTNAFKQVAFATGVQNQVNTSN